MKPSILPHVVFDRSTRRRQDLAARSTIVDIEEDRAPRHDRRNQRSASQGVSQTSSLFYEIGEEMFAVGIA
jgi:hypothetical protein